MVSDAVRFAVVFAALTLVLLCLAGCQGGPEQGPPGRVLIIGIDGASPTLVRPWVAAGQLPNLAALYEQGTFGELRSQHPLLSPRVWTSIATGKDPEQHRIEGWVHDEGPRKGRLYLGSDRAGHAIWNILSDRGYTVGVVNWLMTQPPEQVNGVIVSDFAIPGQRSGREELGTNFGRDSSLPPDRAESAITTWPVDWTQTVREFSRPGQWLPGVDDPGAEWAGDQLVKPLIEQPRYTDDVAVRLALEIDRQVHPDTMMVLLQGIDRVSHFFWAGVTEPAEYPVDQRVTPAQHEQYRRILAAYYHYTDALIGVLSARFTTDDLIIVVSDHGFEPRTQEGDGTTGGHYTKAAEYGIAFFRGPGVPHRHMAYGLSVNDITPSVLSWMGLPVAEDMSGSPAPFLAGRTLKTYDGSPIERVETNADDQEKDTLDRLRSLGYLN